MRSALACSCASGARRHTRGSSGTRNDSRAAITMSACHRRRGACDPADPAAGGVLPALCTLAAPCCAAAAGAGCSSAA